MARDWDEGRRSHEDRSGSRRHSGGRSSGEDGRRASGRADPQADRDYGAPSHHAERAAMDPGYHDDFGDFDFGTHNRSGTTFGGDLGHAAPWRRAVDPGYLDRGYPTAPQDPGGPAGRPGPRRPRGERSWWDAATEEVSSWFGGRDAAGGMARVGHSGKGPKSYVRSDERILEDVNDRLTDDPFIDASDVAVTVASREVTLDGMVESRAAKRRAEDLAESVSGVVHCQNNLRVRGVGQAATDPATATRPDDAG